MNAGTPFSVIRKQRNEVSKNETARHACVPRSWAEISYREQKRDDDGERQLRVRHGWFPKQRNGVTDGLDTCHRRATAGKGTVQHPGTHCLGCGRKRRRRFDQPVMRCA